MFHPAGCHLVFYILRLSLACEPTEESTYPHAAPANRCVIIPARPSGSEVATSMAGRSTLSMPAGALRKSERSLGTLPKPVSAPLNATHEPRTRSRDACQDAYACLLRSLCVEIARRRLPPPGDITHWNFASFAAWRGPSARIDRDPQQWRSVALPHDVLAPVRIPAYTISSSENTLSRISPAPPRSQSCTAKTRPSEPWTASG